MGDFPPTTLTLSDLMFETLSHRSALFRFDALSEFIEHGAVEGVHLRSANAWSYVSSLAVMWGHPRASDLASPADASHPTWEPLCLRAYVSSIGTSPYRR